VKAVDAGVICDHFLGLHSARQKDLGVDPSSLAVIGRTPAFPTGSSPPAGASRLTRSQRSPGAPPSRPRDPAHARILASAEMRGFQRTTRAEYLERLADPAPRGRR